MNSSREPVDPEIRLEAAKLIVDQGYKIKAVCETMGVSKSTLEEWVRQLQLERKGETPK